MNSTTIGNRPPAGRSRMGRSAGKDRRGVPLWLSMAFLSLMPGIAPAADAGGSVARLPGDATAITYLAQPDVGYRFAGWQGDCEATIGPLCTLGRAPVRPITAHFQPNRIEAVAAGAVLLLHGTGQDRRVWDEVVNRQFGGHCPTVYGGVILSQATQPEAGPLRCYRIEFGYYEAVDDGHTASGDQSTTEQLTAELRAAVVGLQQRHPQLKLVLAGSGRGHQLARRFLQKGGRQRQAVAGIVEVADGEGARSGAVAPGGIAPQARDLLRLP